MAKCVVRTMDNQPCRNDAVEGSQLCKGHLASVKKYGDRSWPVFGGFVPATGKHDPSKNPVPSASIQALKAMGKAPKVEKQAKVAKPAKVSKKQKAADALAVVKAKGKAKAEKLEQAVAKLEAATASTPAPVEVVAVAPEIKAESHD